MIQVSIDERTRQVFTTFDLVRNKLDDLLIKGIENVSEENYLALLEFKEKLKDLNLNLISELFGIFTDNLEKMNSGMKSLEIRTELAISALKIITAMRIFDRVMTVELIKKNLMKGDD